MNHELPDVQAGFRKRGTRNQIANIHWIIEKAKSSRKTSTYTLLTTPNPLTEYNGDHHFNILTHTYSFSVLLKRKLIHKTVEK